MRMSCPQILLCALQRLQGSTLLHAVEDGETVIEHLGRILKDSKPSLPQH